MTHYIFNTPSKYSMVLIRPFVQLHFGSSAEHRLRLCNIGLALFGVVFGQFLINDPR